MKTVDFLDAIKKRHGLASDYALAKFLGWRQPRISQYRTTPRELDDDGCVEIARALELPPPYVMACIAEARAKSAEAKRYWREAAKLLKTGTAGAIVAATLALSQFAPSAAPAAEVRLSGQAIHYAPRRRRRRTDRWLRRRRRKLQTVIVAAANATTIGKTPSPG